MSVRAKFEVESVTHTKYGPQQLKMRAVYPNPEKDGFKHDEDHAFWNATPYGELMIHIQNPHAAEQFQPGDLFYLDFTRVEA